MKPKDLIKTYGSQNAAAKALGISRQAIHRWFRENRIPMLRQCQILLMQQENASAKRR